MSNQPKAYLDADTARYLVAVADAIADIPLSEAGVHAGYLRVAEVRFEYEGEILSERLTYSEFFPERLSIEAAAND